jgi:chemotaxis-related protein WspB
MQHLIFRLGQDEVAIPIASILRLAPLAELEPLGTRHPAFRGFLRYQGEAIPVVDLAVLRGLPPSLDQMSTRLILLGEGREVRLAVMVERALEMIDLNKASKTDPKSARVWRDAIFSDSFDDGKRLLQVLNWEALLSQDWLTLIEDNPV